jgi:hypothetical protein
MHFKNAHGCAQKAENGFGFDFFRDGDEFLNHTVRVTGDETWVSFLNVEIKRAVKAADAHTFTKQDEKFKPLSARKLMATVFGDRKDVLMVEFMQQGTTITSELYCKTQKQTAKGHSEQKAWNADIQCSAPP